MYNCLSLFVVALVIKTVCAAVGHQPPVEKPEEFASEDGCYSPELNIVLGYNVAYAPPANVAGCKKFICHEDGWIDIHTCGVVQAGSGCKVVGGNSTAPYPQCCPRIVCCDEGRLSAVA